MIETDAEAKDALESYLKPYTKDYPARRTRYRRRKGNIGRSRHFGGTFGGSLWIVRMM